MLNGKIIIGFCTTTMHKEPVKPLFLELIKRVEKRDDVRMLVFHCFEDLYFTDLPDSMGATSVFKTINYDIVDVLVVMQQNEKQTELFDDITKQSLEHGVPVISVDLPRKGAFNIDFDYGDAFADIVEHVISEHGCTKLIHMGGQRNNSFSRTRIDSFAEVLGRHNIPFNEDDVLYGEFWDFPTENAMEEFFASGKPMPEAFVCANDSMAMAVCRKLAQKGYRVPEDVLVTGFDGIEMEKYHFPRLTTAACDHEAVATAIMEICDKIVYNGEKEPYDVKIVYKTRFAASCGCGGANDGVENNRVLSQYVHERDQILLTDEAMHRMGTRIAMEPSLKNAKEQLKYFGNWGTTICVSEEYNRFNTEGFNPLDENLFEAVSDTYPERMLLLFADTGETAPFEGEIFSTEQILPNLCDRFPDNNTLIINPLHSQQLVIGYMLSIYMPLKAYLDSLYSYNMMANRSLEVVRTHEHMAFLNRKLEFMFTHDHLTKIYNRYGFYKDFREDFDAFNKVPKEVFIVSIDLNDMKTINDTYGHHYGDYALCVTANALTGAAKKSGLDVICSRFGGDEFVVAKLCSGDAQQQADAYREAFDAVLAELNESSGYPFKVSASIGIYCSSLENIDTIDELIDLADRLMYNDKARHKRRPKNM